MIVALAGGTGAAKLLRGLAGVTEPSRLFVVGNTGDDLDWWGLHVSPDLDSVAYALAGLLDAKRGWGVRDDTFHCLEAMDRLGRETWFRLGDRDLATHLHRTLLMRAGASLTVATRAIADSLGVTARIVPMSDDPVRTELRTPGGWLGLEEFFVRERCAPEVLDVAYRGADAARARARRPRGGRRGGGRRRLLLEPRDVDRADPRGARHRRRPGPHEGAGGGGEPDRRRRRRSAGRPASCSRRAGSRSPRWASPAPTGPGSTPSWSTGRTRPAPPRSSGTACGRS